jgi:hypothetical protein
VQAGPEEIAAQHMDPIGECARIMRRVIARHECDDDANSGGCGDSGTDIGGCAPNARDVCLIGARACAPAVAAVSTASPPAERLQGLSAILRRIENGYYDDVGAAKLVGTIGLGSDGVGGGHARIAADVASYAASLEGREMEGDDAGVAASDSAADFQQLYAARIVEPLARMKAKGASADEKVRQLTCTGAHC